MREGYVINPHSVSPLLHIKPKEDHIPILYHVILAFHARLYYVLFSWDLYKNNLLSIFNTRQGGLAIYGGVLGAFATLFVYCRIKKLSPYPLIQKCRMHLYKVHGTVRRHLCHSVQMRLRNIRCAHRIKRKNSAIKRIPLFAGSA